MGWINWAQPVLSIVFDGAGEATDHYLEQILGRERYYRFQTVIDQASDDLDDASEENLDALRREAAKLVGDCEERLEEVCAKLR